MMLFWKGTVVHSSRQRWIQINKNRDLQRKGSLFMIWHLHQPHYLIIFHLKTLNIIWRHLKLFFTVPCAFSWTWSAPYFLKAGFYPLIKADVLLWDHDHTKENAVTKTFRRFSAGECEVAINNVIFTFFPAKANIKLMWKWQWPLLNSHNNLRM